MEIFKVLKFKIDENQTECAIFYFNCNLFEHLNPIQWASIYLADVIIYCWAVNCVNYDEYNRLLDDLTGFAREIKRQQIMNLLYRSKTRTNYTIAIVLYNIVILLWMA